MSLFRPDDQVEVQLGHFCTNRCQFCVSGQLTEQGLAPPIPLEQVRDALERAAEQGIRRVTLLGGEPTIQATFLPVLRLALELGLDDVVIFTNGARTHSRAFMEEVCALGRFTWRFSVQGGDEETHDLTVGRRGAFARLLAGMRWLQEQGHDLTANTCACGRNHRSLDRLPALLIDHGVRQLHVDLVRPAGTGVRGEEELRALLPPFAELAPSLASMLREADRIDPDWDVHVGNLPFCVLPDLADRIHHGGQPTATVTTDDRGSLSRVWRKFPYQRTGMVFPSGCDGCSMRDLCRGVPEEYVRFHGDAEFAALGAVVRAEVELSRKARGRRGDDPRGGLGSLLRRVRRLRRAAPLAGWSWAGARSAGRSSVVVTLAGEGGRLELTLEGGAVRFGLLDGATPGQARPVVEAVSTLLASPGQDSRGDGLG